MNVMKKSGGDKSKLVLIVPLVLLLILAFVGVASALFFYKSDSNEGVKAKEFYFTSNLLDGTTHTLAPGSTEISFELRNHEDRLRYSEANISYNVKVNGGFPSGTNLSGNLARGMISDCVVTITGLTPGNTYTITADGEAGYHKTLTATLVIPENESGLYKYLDTSNPDYVLLTVWAKGVRDTVRIAAPTVVIPDNTDAVMKDAKTGVVFEDTVTFRDTEYASHVYRFFGNGVTVDDFVVNTTSGITATADTPN